MATEVMVRDARDGRETHPGGPANDLQNPRHDADSGDRSDIIVDRTHEPSSDLRRQQRKPRENEKNTGHAPPAV
jgi:hypothetical protein